MGAAMDRWTRRAGVVLMVVLLAAGCSGRNTKPTEADRQVEAASAVLSAMTQGLKTRNVDALVRLWRPDRRDAVRARIRTALARKGTIDVTLSLVGVRLEPERRLARVAWRGTWGGEPLSGGFEMELTGSDPPLIADIRGEDPTGGAPGGGPTGGGALPATVP
jgi:hypothetical protein